jgi:hypothetical protein
MTLSATLYTRAGCHLCEDAAANLGRLRSRHPQALRRVAIACDAERMRP